MVKGEVAYAQTVKHKIGRDFYVFGKNVRAKGSTCLPDNKHISVFSRVLAALDFTGTCCIDYKIENELPKLLEINPRYGASLTGDINRYLEAYLISLGVLDKQVFRSGKVPHAVRMQRFLQSLNGNIAFRSW